ncbi:MAG: hypothetical protein COA96_10240 [SAR86 cluster bacterium]|uniref:Uncharacterized protein n=1 Tax=SAR86 cluster bacterium TaxID=2030880 RepID=A0A2A5AY11_9GAMM|nr:MAG: hypothetical protein COA96_10240 [SAR86 cluster bacterium]
MKPQEIITDSQIETVHAYADFGSMGKRMVVNESLLKLACGFHNGSTAQHILADHGLIFERYGKRSHTLTAKGRKYLWAVYAP